KVFAFCAFFVYCASSAQAGAEKYNNYQWNQTRSDWFEWWYYKVNIPNTKEAFYFIYGIVNPWDKNQTRNSSRAYVAFGSFSDFTHHQNEFSVGEFFGDANSPHVKIRENEADAQSLKGKITSDNGEEVAAWDLKMKNDWAFNAMGWGVFFPEI